MADFDVTRLAGVAFVVTPRAAASTVDEIMRLQAARIAELESALIQLGADSFSALYGVAVHTAQRVDDLGEPFGLREAIAAIREEQKRGRESHQTVGQLRTTVEAQAARIAELEGRLQRAEAMMHSHAPL